MHPPNHTKPKMGSLFELGTGTHGPAPRPKFGVRPAAGKPVPYGDALRHIVRTVDRVLWDEGVHLGDGPKQDLISTVFIAAAKKTPIEFDFTREVEE